MEVQCQTSVLKQNNEYFIWGITSVFSPVLTVSSKCIIPPENMVFLNVSRFDINISRLNLSQWNDIVDYAAPPSEHCTDLLELLHVYYLPTVILVGLIGNIISCIVFLNTYLKMRSSSYYLAALSTADFGFLLSISFVWLNNNFGIEVYNTNGWCQGLVYLSSVCSFLSVWLIVSFTVERFIAVQYPLHRPRMCTVHRAKTVISVLTAIAVILYTYSFLTVGMKKDELGQEACYLRDGYDKAMRVISIIDSLLTLIIPLVLIIVMNTMIMKNLLEFGQRLERSDSTSQSNRKHMFSLQWFRNSSGTTETTQNSLGSQVQESAVPSRRSDSITPGLSISSARSPGTTKLQLNITKMLLLISSVSVLLNLPSYILRLYSLWHQKTPESLWCIQQLCMLLYYTNFSINFLLYSMYGITFRRCLWQLIHNKFRAVVNSLCGIPY